MKTRVVLLGFRAVQVMGKWSGSVYLACPPLDVEQVGFSSSTWKILRERVPVIQGVLTGKLPALVDLECVSYNTATGVTINEVQNAVVVAPLVSIRDATGKVGFEFGDELSDVPAARAEV